MPPSTGISVICRKPTGCAPVADVVECSEGAASWLHAQHKQADMQNILSQCKGHSSTHFKGSGSEIPG